ncbi:uncharacterized protein EDB91DRAFT_1057727 [Suillus paluster]|uniref:uncharacterized protein n=1 Tax=Suillus paluster TaxID=48578 RepID=UPI001B871A76|nr:uncharacterized protein EDB91DRAFT_1057727 [Suillus paluster]KAG1733039.1 hypothetical protein EDB91DRAFT_1057727 [Suillus paluster]
MFMKSADELFGPVTTIRCPASPAKHIPWKAFTIGPVDWEHINTTRNIVSDANNIQQYFSSELQPTLWRAIPAIEELQTAWEAKCDDPKYTLFKPVIELRLEKVNKYYRRFDEKPVYVLALVLHLYYKLNYIKMAWGGPKEQELEHAAGNPNAVDWHDEVLKIVEKTMREYSKCMPTGATTHSSSPINPLASTETLESEFDRH